MKHILKCYLIVVVLQLLHISPSRHQKILFHFCFWKLTKAIIFSIYLLYSTVNFPLQQIHRLHCTIHRNVYQLHNGLSTRRHHSFFQQDLHQIFTLVYHPEHICRYSINELHQRRHIHQQHLAQFRCLVAIINNNKSHNSTFHQLHQYPSINNRPYSSPVLEAF